MPSAGRVPPGGFDSPDADRLVQQLFDLLEEEDPDSDPGDLTIDIQDDMPLVELYTHPNDKSGPHGVFARASSIRDALLDAISQVEARRRS